jgi:D-alanyl-D-alanine carboxypeptidase/D-alanyl-D-alanine-endopeptidase (penicillin-binding protein 4)
MFIVRSAPSRFGDGRSDAHGRRPGLTRTGPPTVFSRPSLAGRAADDPIASLTAKDEPATQQEDRMPARSVRTAAIDHRRRRRQPASTGRLAVMLLTLLTLTTSAAAGLREDIDLLIRTTDLGGATVAVSVVEAGPGTPLANIRAGEPMIPASNMKLLTTGAALHVLGADFRFRTRIVRDGNRLIVIGDGDPAFGDPELLSHMRDPNGVPLDAESFLELWVQPIVDAGLTAIDELVVDDRIFDRQFVHDTWPDDQLNRRYCAQVSGLTFHQNVVHFFPEPRSGERPSVSTYRPTADGLHVRNRATSNTGPKDRDSVWIARKLGTNELTFYGNVKHQYRTPVPVTVHDMPQLFAEMLAERLDERGVEVGEARVATVQDPPSEGELIGPVIFTPIETVITRCNRESENLYAECLLKRLGQAMTGQPGSWLNGASIVRHVVLERLDDVQSIAALTVADGSGLSRENRVTPATLTAWLNSFHNDEKLGRLLIDSLATGGEDGTLRRRMRTVDLEGASVQAKSGYINRVSCLSGYVTAADGRRRCFSVMVNDLRAPVRKAKRLQDEIVAAIASDMADQPAALGSD